jgi:hypothetical protein
VNAAPLRLREANRSVARHRRQGLPTVGGQFAPGAAPGGKPVGVAAAGSPACERLVAEANRHGGNDNITVIVAQVGGPASQARAAG